MPFREELNTSFGRLEVGKAGLIVPELMHHYMEKMKVFKEIRNNKESSEFLQLCCENKIIVLSHY